MNGLECAEFLKVPGRILDVRSPSEYLHAHIPGAYSLPLFSDEERASVGLAYKTMGKESAVALGISYAGPRLSNLLDTAKSQVEDGVAKVHCWRGGMRSSSVAWLLKTAGLETVTLKGGYKAFRRWVAETLKRPYPLIVIGGFTGSGKTEILHHLQAYKEQCLDLEALASHRGSAYGHIDMTPQPSNEQFENALALHLSCFSLSSPIWIEDESRMIGKCKIPDLLYHQMLAAPLYFIRSPRQTRVLRLKESYGNLPLQALREATLKISKKFGGKKTQEILTLLDEGDLTNAIALSLEYYDTTYEFGLSKKSQPVIHLSTEAKDSQEIAETLLKMRNNE